MDESPLLILIAIGGLYLAWSQGEVERNRLRMELFDRRWRVFAACQRTSRRANGSAKLTDEDLRDLEEAIDGYQFIFGKDLVVFIESFWKAAIQLRYAGEAVADYEGAGPLSSDAEDGHRQVRDSREAALEFFRAHAKSLNERFRSDMELRA